MQGRPSRLAAGLKAVAFMLLVAPTPHAFAESWCDAPPAPEFAALKPAEVQDDWFKVFAVAPGVYAITEPRQYEAVSSFLIVGSKRAVLFDSGMGIGVLSEEFIGKSPTQVTRPNPTEQV